MRAGKLDRLISIIEATDSISDFGDAVQSWSVVSHRVWARVAPLSGDERQSNPQLVANQSHEFTIRYSTLVADIGPLQRIVYPALAAGALAPETLGRNIFQIVSTDMVGNKEGIRIRAFARADLPIAESQEGVPIELLWGAGNNLEWGAGNELNWGEG